MKTLCLISRWLDDNLMKANVSKTKVMILGTLAKTYKVNDANIVMNNSTVEKVNSFTGRRMGRSDKVSLWYVSLLINTRFHFFILE